MSNENENKISRADYLAHPKTDTTHPNGQVEFNDDGMTIREHFCLHAGVPATGDDELDAIIREGERRRMAGQVMAAIMSNPYSDGYNQPLCTASSEEMAPWAVEAADALLAELEKGEG